MAVNSPAELAAWAERYVSQAPQKAARAARERASSTREETRAQSVAIFAALRKDVRCSVCGRELTDKASQELGIGPDCLAKQKGATS